MKACRLFVCIVCVSMFWPFAVRANSVASVRSSNVPDDGDVVVRIVLRPDDPVNAVEGIVRYDPEVLRVEDINTVGSPVTLWVQSPTVVSLGVIRFAGAIPGGYAPALATEATLFTVLFRPVVATSTQVRLEETKVYLSTGDGRLDEVSNVPGTLTVKPMIGHQERLTLDFVSPEPFTVTEMHSPDMYDDRLVALFQTTDKDSGIDRYEVREKRFGVWGVWHEEVSPLVLRDQSRLSILQVRAIDRVGRERMVQFIPIHLWLLWGGLAALIFVAIVRLSAGIIRRAQ